jgi:hypothetical protein
VKHRPDDLAAFRRVGTAVAVPLDHDHGRRVGIVKARPASRAGISPRRPGARDAED